MPQILHTTLVPSQSLAATAENFQYDLPVNPMSAIIVTIKALNDTGTVTDYSGAPETLLSKLTNLRCRFRGATIFDGTPLDLINVFGRYSGWWPVEANPDYVNNHIRAITFPLLFGRHAYDPMECFPATRRGDLILEVDTAADPTGLDTGELQIGTVELLDAVPERFIKVTTTQRTMQQGDVNDIDLPIGNHLVGMLLAAADFPSSLNHDCSFARVALEIDNVEVQYSEALWYDLHALWRMKTRLDWLYMGHRHVENTAAAYAQFAETDDAWITTNAERQYGWMELDPMMDLSMAIDTRGAADIKLSVDSDNTDATASRVLPVEYVQVRSPTTPEVTV